MTGFIPVHYVWMWSDESTVCGLKGVDRLTDEREEVTCRDCIPLL